MSFSPVHFINAGTDKYSGVASSSPPKIKSRRIRSGHFFLSLVFALHWTSLTSDGDHGLPRNSQSHDFFHAGSPLRPFLHMQLTFRLALPFLNTLFLITRLFGTTEKLGPWQVLFFMHDFLV